LFSFFKHGKVRGMSIERGKRPERRKLAHEGTNQTPIHVIFGGNDPQHVADLVHLDTAIKERLEKTQTGQVVVFVEDGFASEGSAAQIEQYISRGLPPSISYGVVRFVEENDRKPQLENPQDVNEIFAGLSRIDPFQQQQLEILDNNYKKSDKRVRLLWESRPLEDHESECISLENAAWNVEQVSFPSVTSGTFKEGLSPFRQYVGFLVDDSQVRDVRLAERVAFTTADTEVVAIVGYRGRDHLVFKELLSQWGYPITASVIMKDQNVLETPLVDAIQQKTTSPKELSDEVWYRLLIGSTVHHEMVAEAIQSDRRDITHEQILTVAHEIMDKLPTMRSIKRFEKEVRRKGFMQAVENLVS
jgi:hypothetical protein